MGPDPTLLLMGGQAEMRDRLRWAEGARRAETAASASPRPDLGRLRRAVAALVAGGRVSLTEAAAPAAGDDGRRRR